MKERNCSVSICEIKGELNLLRFRKNQEIREINSLKSLRSWWITGNSPWNSQNTASKRDENLWKGKIFPTRVVCSITGGGDGGAVAEVSTSFPAHFLGAIRAWKKLWKNFKKKMKKRNFFSENKLEVSREMMTLWKQPGLAFIGTACACNFTPSALRVPIASPHKRSASCHFKFKFETTVLIENHLDGGWIGDNANQYTI